MKINIIKSLLLYLLGLLIILFTIYRRFIVIRLPKDLYIITMDKINIGLVYFIIVSILISGFLLNYNLKTLLGKNHAQSFISKYTSKIDSIIEDALQHMYGLIYQLLNDPYNKMSKFTLKFYTYFKDISETLFLFIIYGIRLIILLCFLIDVFINFRLDFMYKSLYLLIITLGIKILFYMLRDLAANLEELESMLQITPKGIDPATNLPITEYSFKNEYKHSNLCLRYYIEQYILCSKMSGYLEYYDRYKAFFSPYFNTILYLIYFVTWNYILCYNLFLIFQ